MKLKVFSKHVANLELVKGSTLNNDKGDEVILVGVNEEFGGGIGLSSKLVVLNSNDEKISVFPDDWGARLVWVGEEQMSECSTCHGTGELENMAGCPDC